MLLRIALLLSVCLAPCAAAQTAADENEDAIGGLLQLGQQLWDNLAPDHIKEEYRFPTMEDAAEFLAALEADLEEGSPQQLAAYEADARAALQLLRRIEGGDTLADWLEPRLEYLAASVEIVAPSAQPLPVPASRPQFTQPYWANALANRPPPANAARFTPLFKDAFEKRGVPPALIWISEVESHMNPKAKSPVGAKGAFQFMPATAERFGLSSSWPDEREDPAKSADAAAQYLKILYNQFQSWPLAIAAYNAGEGRVGRLLKKTGTKDYDSLAQHLPTETRMYVPKVLATVAKREGLDPHKLPSPR